MYKPFCSLLLACISLTNSVRAAPTLEQLQAEIESLKATVTTLQTALNADIVKGNDTLTSMQHQLTLVASNPALQLGPFVSVDPNPENGVRGPNIVFKGANIHIISGSGSTADQLTGLGNLIIGYDEAPVGLQPGERGGSHNLVVGVDNVFTTGVYGGVVFGSYNALNSDYSSILGGAYNRTLDVGAVVVGGSKNTVAGNGEFAVIVGGTNNDCSGASAAVLGGSYNIADGNGSTVVSGYNNNDSLALSTVIGGYNIDILAVGVYGIPCMPTSGDEAIAHRMLRI